MLMHKKLFWFLLPAGALLMINFYTLKELQNSASDDKSQAIRTDVVVDSGTIADESSLTSTKNPNKYVILPIPQGAISVGGCCGLGHRMTRLIPSVVYGVTNNQVVLVNWTDVEWNVLFNDTAQVKQGPKLRHHYKNKFPNKWEESILAKFGTETFQEPNESSTYDKYSVVTKRMFAMPLAHSVAKSLSENLSPRVLKFLDPIRRQYASKNHSDSGRGLHLCTHIREGDNETDLPAWRNIDDLNATLKKTLLGMKDYVFSMRAGNITLNDDNGDDKLQIVSMFVASNTEKSRLWLEQNAPNNWHVVKSPQSHTPKPNDGGHWFKWGRKTYSITKEQMNELMAEAVSDAFALGECDALFIPTYSSFSMIGIMLSIAERQDVFFLGNEGKWIELPKPKAAGSHSQPETEKEGGSREGEEVLERTECTFCKGGIPKPEMVVPQTGGNTCGSIQLLAVKDYSGTGTCEILREQESVCCPELDTQGAVQEQEFGNEGKWKKLPKPKTTGSHSQPEIEKEGGSREGEEVLERTECTFCKGGIPKPEMFVPQTGGNTCDSIQQLAVKDYSGTDT
eukprot:scaffold1951_cov137-Skeletonema_menzelii.AAC.4